MKHKSHRSKEVNATKMDKHIKQPNIILPKEKTPLDILVEKDRERFKKIYKPLYEQIINAAEKGSYIESFLLAWTFVEQILLPSLIREISHRLKLENTPKLNERTQINQLILYYYFLSHDSKLYNNLVKGNKQRNNLIHGLESIEDATILNKKAKNALKFTLNDIAYPLEDRLDGVITVPVLTIYSRGWNDCRAAAIKRLEETLK